MATKHEITDVRVGCTEHFVDLRLTYQGVTRDYMIRFFYRRLNNTGVWLAEEINFMDVKRLDADLRTVDRYIFVAAYPVRTNFIDETWLCGRVMELMWKFDQVGKTKESNALLHYLTRLSDENNT